MQFLLLTVFFSLYIGIYSKFSGFNLDHTDHLLNGLDRDCLYYNAHDENDTVFQIVEYCIRFQVNEAVVVNKDQHSSFTFDALRQAKVTSRQLYTWSAPIDLIEHYQNYLENRKRPPGEFVFYNCTYPWFGSRCEYTFGQPELNFAHQVESSFDKKALVFFTIKHGVSCYLHLRCDRAGDHGQVLGACLDWREVCDGKVDCLDGGGDEDQCWQLEINECNYETEFRCHNGLCIPLLFVADDPRNADCLDQSDEGSIRTYVRTDQSIEELKRHVKPIFRNEEHMCYPRRITRDMDHSVECGYPRCGSFLKSPIEVRCFNRRTDILREAYRTGANVSEKCYQAISCLSDILDQTTNHSRFCTAHLIHTYPKIVKQH